MNLNLFLHELRQAGNSIKGASIRRSLKSRREHWGVSAPVCARIASAASKPLDQLAILSLAKGLWQTDIFDPMICAAKLLSLPKVKPSKELWDLVIVCLKDVDGWTLEDQLAPAAQKCVLAAKERLDEIEQWTIDSNMWMRRAALVYTLPFAKPGQDPERMLKWASSYAKDREWFIQKAIGWWLRTLGEHNPQRVCEFLKDHWPHLQQVARHEATRKLGFEWQRRIQRGEGMVDEPVDQPNTGKRKRDVRDCRHPLSKTSQENKKSKKEFDLPQ